MRTGSQDGFGCRNIRRHYFVTKPLDLPPISEFGNALKGIKRFVHIKSDAVHIFYKWLVPDHGMAT